MDGKDDGSTDETMRRDEDEREAKRCRRLYYYHTIPKRPSYNNIDTQLIHIIIV
jgi:hypothetical protein